VPAQEMRVIFHPTRARILELLKGGGPADRTGLAERAGAPLAAVAYHCRALLRSRCIRFAPTFSYDSENPVYEVP
jgi:DNA-binding IclR family transcriptional regulator